MHVGYSQAKLKLRHAADVFPLRAVRSLSGGPVEELVKRLIGEVTCTFGAGIMIVFTLAPVQPMVMKVDGPLFSSQKELDQGGGGNAPVSARLAGEGNSVLPSCGVPAQEVPNPLENICKLRQV